MIKLSVPETTVNHILPRITVIGVGGAGCNAVNNMITANLEGVDFIVANTDAQALALSRTDRRIQLGERTTQGLGAGARPDVGRAAAEEALEEIITNLQGSNMVFITAGMGGGTGTGAAPVIARAAREIGVLTVGVVTKPFQFEGVRRMSLAESGIEELAMHVDTLIVIPNQNLFRVANEKTTFADAFKMADDVLHSGVRSVTDLMIMPGLINLDFADVRTVMAEMGKAMMGTGEAEGENRALRAAEMAIANPLLDDTSMAGARGVLINISGGMDLTLFEVDEAANRIRDEVDIDANIIFGSCFDESLQGKMRVSVVATGIASEQKAKQPQLSPYGFSGNDKVATATATATPATATKAPSVIASAPKPATSTVTAPMEAVRPAEKPLEAAPPSPASNAIPSMPPATELFATVRGGKAAEPVVAETNRGIPMFKPRVITSREQIIETPARPAAPVYQQAQPAPVVEQAPSPVAAPVQEDLFIPPAPATPENETRSSYAPAPAVENKTPVVEPNVERASVPTGAHSRSIFERVIGMSSVRKAKAEEQSSFSPKADEIDENDTSIRTTVAVSAEDRATTSFGNADELEIPSFLRRKTN